MFDDFTFSKISLAFGLWDIPLKLGVSWSQVNSLEYSMYTFYVLNEILTKFIDSGKFTAQEVILSLEMTEEWVQFRTNPQRFLPQIFDGEWAWPNRKPQVGPIRIVRVLPGSDGVHRLIGRQGAFIYATPWIGM